jgi:hypothetical protein
MGQGPGAPTGGIASALGDASVDELMSRMAGSTGSAADPLSGLLAAAGGDLSRFTPGPVIGGRQTFGQLIDRGDAVSDR